MKKMYTNPSRKPMMGGGYAMAKPRKKMEAGGKATADATANADIQSRVATGRATAKDKAAMEKQRIEELERMTMAELRKIAGGNMSDKDTMLARKVLRDKGDAGAMPSGDKEPTSNTLRKNDDPRPKSRAQIFAETGKAYGGKAKKK